MRFGNGLREERERRGISLDEISVATRVSLKNLQALENERFEDLPGGVFNRGIVRSYARFIGMNEDEAVNGYVSALRQHGVDPAHENEDWVTFAENVRRSRSSDLPRKRLRWAGVFGMLLLILLLAAGVLSYLTHRGAIPAPPNLRHLLHLAAAPALLPRAALSAAFL